MYAVRGVGEAGLEKGQAKIRVGDPGKYPRGERFYFGFSGWFWGHLGENILCSGRSPERFCPALGETPNLEGINFRVSKPAGDACRARRLM